MPRFHRLAGAVALALGCAGAAQAQNFTGFFVFGDSLSDAGNIAATQGLPPGNSFTTNPDPVAAEIIARYFGLPDTNSLAGGPNFAWGGACVNATGPCLNPVPNIPTQISQYLASTGGTADPNALYSIWGGANDIFASLGNPATAQANTVAAATAYVQQIGRLQAAGARYVIVYNLPNLGATPQFGANPTVAASVSQITVVYNSALNTGLAQLGVGLIPINTFGLIEEIRRNPGLYGFTNITGVACSGSSVACGPSGSGLPATYAPGTNETYLFADGVHPTGAAHRILANVVLSTIAAPIQVSYAGEGGLQAAADHSRAVNDELMSDFQLNREVGSVRGFATVNFGQHEYEDNASTNILGGDADALSLTLGANHRASENAYWGVGITLGNHDNGIASADIESRSVIGSIGGAFRFGGGYVHGAVSGGSTDVEVSRFIEMGPSVREETGTTNASQYGAELGFGWLFGSAEGVQHGPFIGAQWVKQTVDGFAEDSGSASSMNFAEFDRDSLVTRVGYQLMGNLGDSERAIRPFARVAFNEEGEDDQVQVNAGSNSMPGRFTIGGFTPSKDWISADVGVQFMVGDNTTAYLSYNGRFADDLQDRNTFGLGLRTTF